MKSLVTPAIDHSVRDLCRRPYPGHPKGCPNFGKRPSCPPAAPLLPDILDMTEPIWAVYTSFDLAGHVKRMLDFHPHWSRRQLECCLYWQGTARKNLEAEIHSFLWGEFMDVDCQIACWSEPKVVRCPEACGVNVTETMKSIGEILEWPPVTKTYQVALVGIKKEM